MEEFDDMGYDGYEGGSSLLCLRVGGFWMGLVSNDLDLVWNLDQCNTIADGALRPPFNTNRIHAGQTPILGPHVIQITQKSKCNAEGTPSTRICAPKTDRSAVDPTVS
jgi:hypothetical protein